MKFIVISDGLIINLESIYALNIVNNNGDIEEWENKYKEYFDIIMKNPISFDIDGEDYAPDFDDEIDNEKLKKYTNLLNKYIITKIGDKPEYNEYYITILNNGSNVKISKEIYNILYDYIIKLDTTINLNKKEN